MRKVVMLVMVLIFCLPFALPQASSAGAEPFLGEVIMVGFTFCPRGWAECNGQLLSISQNTALFSLLGTTYGGDGRTTFALPDLRGRVPLHTGTGPGLSTRTQGQKGGEEDHALTVQEMPVHNHSAQASSFLGDDTSPAGNVWAARQRFVKLYNNQQPDVAMASEAIGDEGGSQAHNTMQPYLVIRYCIALQGIFPSRN
jgi:microcystin-dependent protein